MLVVWWRVDDGRMSGRDVGPLKGDVRRVSSHTWPLLTSTFWTPHHWPHQDWPISLQHLSSHSPPHASQTIPRFDYLSHLTHLTSLSLTWTIKSRTSTPTPHPLPSWNSRIHPLPLLSRTYIVKSLSRLPQLHSYTLPSVLSIPYHHNFELISYTSSTHISHQRTINSTPHPDLLLLITLSENQEDNCSIHVYTENMDCEIDGVGYKKDGSVSSSSV